RLSPLFPYTTLFRSDLHVRRLQIVRAGADVEQPGGKLRRVGGGVGVAVVGQRLDAQRGQRAVLLRRQLGRDVVVARERVGLQVRSEEHTSELQSRVD